MVFRCNTVAQMFCTTWMLVCLLALGVGTVMSHQSFSILIPAIVDMPANLKEGLESVLNFDALESAAEDVKRYSSEALAKCAITDPGVGCNAAVPTVNAASHDVSDEVDGVSAAFDATLDTIQKVVNDKYLGIDDFQETAKSLDEMKDSLQSLKGEDGNGTVDCLVIKEGFCPIWENGDEIVSSMDDVREAMESITDSDAVAQFEQYSQATTGLHLLPYIGWLGVLFYMCFFCTGDVLTVCRGGSCGGCVAYSCYFFFFGFWWLVAVLVGGFAVAGSVLAQEYAIEEPFKGKPTLAVLIDHIEVTFPKFYELVLEDIIHGLWSLRRAFVINAIAASLFCGHGLISCCCGIYNDANRTSV